MTITQAALPGSSIDTLLLIYNSAGILVAADNDGAGSQISQVQFSILPGQTYDVEAEALGWSQGSYSLSIATRDGDDTLAQPRSVTLSAQGTASESRQVDMASEGNYLQFVALSSRLMAVEEDAAPGSTMRVAAAILDSSGNSLPDVSSTTLAGRTSVRL